MTNGRPISRISRLTEEKACNYFFVVVCITLIKGRTQQNYLRIYPNAPFIIMDCLYSYYCQKHSQQNVAIPDTGCSSICSTAGLSVKMSQAYKA